MGLFDVFDEYELDIPNPLDYELDIPNPLDYELDLPNPMDYVHQGEHVVDNVLYGEENHAPNPAMAGKGEDLKAKYQADAYKTLGIDEHEFATMDPIQRNQLINAAYAQMYKKDPDSYKWAGMAAMASDKAGTGMMQTYMLEAGETVPGGSTAEGALGAPDGDKVRGLLAKGNAGIFNDMYWQHLAFDHGGIKELEAAAKEGSITAEQLAGWKKLALGQEELKKAKASGDKNAIAAAQQDVWAGNGTLLHGEQKFVQDLVYDESPESRQAFQFLSGSMNVMGVNSPVPGGTSFNDYREKIPGKDDVGDFDQRWGWIEDKMLPEYKDLETNRNGQMMDKMNGFIDKRHTNPWMQKVVNPLEDLTAPFLGLF